jgi:hypothetical protein
MKKFMILSLIASIFMMSDMIQAEVSGIDDAYIDLTEDYLYGGPIGASVSSVADNKAQLRSSELHRDRLLNLINSQNKEEAAISFKRVEPLLLDQHKNDIKNAFAQKHGYQLK